MRKYEGPTRAVTIQSSESPGDKAGVEGGVAKREDGQAEFLFICQWPLWLCQEFFSEES